MIHENRTLIPEIDFGLGHKEKTVETGEVITVWLSTIYNQSVYSITLLCAGGVKRVSDFEYEVTFDAPGTYYISMEVNTHDKKINLKSNSLKLNVTEKNG